MPFQVALDGYIVVATDYAGLGVRKDANGKTITHEYLTGPAQANDVYYSVLAVRQAFPALSKDYVVIGTSQGGMAAWASAQKLAIEPLPGYLGSVILHPVTRLLDLPLHSPIMPLLLTMLAPSLIEKFPDFKAKDIFTPRGVANFELLNEIQGSNTVLYALPTAPEDLQPRWYDNHIIRSYNQFSATGRQSVVGPLLIIQGTNDPIVSAETTTAAVRETAEMFPTASIEYRLLPGVTHDSTMFASQHLYMDWIAARFAGHPTKEGLHEHVAQPLRPGASQERDANWFVQGRTEHWQMF